jgi:lipid-A-disaccharide synthase
MVAAEASSELYGRRIIEEARRRSLFLSFYGIGSQAMNDMGFDLVEKSENMAVVGLWEVVAHWSVISNAFRSLVNRAKKKHPAAALLMDYPDFNLRLAKKLHNLGIPVLYFISPQVWAWRTGRVHLIKRIVSRMLVVFPFEKNFYESFNVPVSFVGHPLLDEVKNSILDHERRHISREQMGVSANDFLVGLLPGSRASELKHNFQTQLEAALEIKKKRPQAKFLILVAPTLDKDNLAALIPKDFSLEIRVVKDEPLKILQLCDACIVASGTATLMTGLAGTPMVIMYKMNAMTGFLARRLVKGTFFGMANLILGEKVVPELFQQEANPENLSAEIVKYIDDQELVKSVRQKLGQIKDRLGNGGAISKVVDNLAELMKAKGVSE